MAHVCKSAVTPPVYLMLALCRMLYGTWARVQALYVPPYCLKFITDNMAKVEKTSAFGSLSKEWPQVVWLMRRVLPSWAALPAKQHEDDASMLLTPLNEELERTLQWKNSLSPGTCA